jgi:hypothetical protein
VSSTKSLGGRELRIVESIDAYRIANQCVHSTPIPTPHLASKPASSGFPSAYAASGKFFNPYFCVEFVLNYEVKGLDVCTLSCLNANASQFFLLNLAYQNIERPDLMPYLYTTEPPHLKQSLSHFYHSLPLHYLSFLVIPYLFLTSP